MAKKAKAATSKPKKSATTGKSASKPAAKAAAPKIARSKTAPAKRKASHSTTRTPAPAVVTKKVVAEVTVHQPLTERFGSIDEAKDATLDALLEIIEAAEERLRDVKRVQTFEELEPLANGRL